MCGGRDEITKLAHARWLVQSVSPGEATTFARTGLLWMYATRAPIDRCGITMVVARSATSGPKRPCIVLRQRAYETSSDLSQRAAASVPAVSAR